MPERAASVVAEVEQLGRRALAVQADTAEEADVVRLFATVDAELGRLDALVNNAGIVGPGCLIEDIVAADLARVLMTNLAGPFICGS